MTERLVTEPQKTRLLERTFSFSRRRTSAMVTDLRIEKRKHAQGANP